LPAGAVVCTICGLPLLWLELGSATLRFLAQFFWGECASDTTAFILSFSKFSMLEKLFSRKIFTFSSPLELRVAEKALLLSGVKPRP
jgi:hypothetical protein